MAYALNGGENMDFKEALKYHKRMCDHYKDCRFCPMILNTLNTKCVFSFSGPCACIDFAYKNPDEFVSTLEEFKEQIKELISITFSTNIEYITTDKKYDIFFEDQCVGELIMEENTESKDEYTIKNIDIFEPYRKRELVTKIFGEIFRQFDIKDIIIPQNKVVERDALKTLECIEDIPKGTKCYVVPEWFRFR